jgi:hypothetical protein
LCTKLKAYHDLVKYRYRGRMNRSCRSYKSAHVFHKRNYSEGPEDRTEASDNVLFGRGRSGWVPNAIQGVASVRKVRFVKFKNKNPLICTYTGDVPRSLYTTPSVWNDMMASAVPDKTTGRRLRVTSSSKIEPLFSDIVAVKRDRC